jgi:NADH dehydrogenase
MFGRGLTRLQPVYVGDVAQAIAKAIEQTEEGDRTFECGGPRVYSYEELLRALMREAGLETRLIPMPFAAWHALARLAEMLPNAPVTRHQIELMQVDNVASRDVPGFAELGISPRSVEDILREMLASPSGRR